MRFIRFNYSQFIKSNLISILIVLIIIIQNRNSFVWNYSPIYAFSLVFILFIYILFSKIIKYKKILLPNILFFITLLGVFLVFVLFNFKVSSLITFICFFSISQINDREKEKALEFLSNFMSILILVSLFCWLIQTFKFFHFPVIGKLDLAVVHNPGYLENYFFFVSNPTLIFPRFYSIFEEPGCVGALLSFLLLANKYNFKKKCVIIFFLGGIFTYSLAFYISTLVGFLFYKIKNIKKLIITLIIVFLFGLIFYLIVKDNEVFQYMIFDRLFDFNKHGLSSRTSSTLNFFFNNYIFSCDSIFGMGAGFSSSLHAGASFKLFIIDYGIIGLLLLFFMYLSISRYKAKNIVALIVYFLVFLPQGNAFVAWQLLLFSITCFSLEKENVNI